MAKVINLPNNRCDLKFGAKPKKFNRIERITVDKQHYLLKIDKNDAVYDVIKSEVISWKTIEKGKRKINVPDEVRESRDVELFNLLQGNPYKIALSKVS